MRSGAVTGTIRSRARRPIRTVRYWLPRSKTLTLNRESYRTRVETWVADASHKLQY